MLFINLSLTIFFNLNFHMSNLFKKIILPLFLLFTNFAPSFSSSLSSTSNPLSPPLAHHSHLLQPPHATSEKWFPTALPPSPHRELPRRYCGRPWRCNTLHRHCRILSKVVKQGLYCAIADNDSTATGKIKKWKHEGGKTIGMNPWQELPSEARRALGFFTI